MKKFISILTVLCLIFTLTPAVALGADSGPPASGGSGSGGGTVTPIVNEALDLRDMETTDGFTNEGWEWDSDTQTLTLDGLDLKVTDGPGIILPDGDVKIVLIKNNKITTDYDDAIRGDYDAATNLTISGNGALVIEAGCCGLYLEEGNITIQSGTIKIEAYTAGFQTGVGNVTIIDGTVNITAEEFGILAEGDVAIKGGEVRAIA